MRTGRSGGQAPAVTASLWARPRAPTAAETQPAEPEPEASFRAAAAGTPEAAGFGAYLAFICKGERGGIGMSPEEASHPLPTSALSRLQAEQSEFCSLRVGKRTAACPLPRLLRAPRADTSRRSALDRPGSLRVLVPRSPL